MSSAAQVVEGEERPSSRWASSLGLRACWGLGRVDGLLHPPSGLHAETFLSLAKANHVSKLVTTQQAAAHLRGLQQRRPIR